MALRCAGAGLTSIGIPAWGIGGLGFFTDSYEWPRYGAVGSVCSLVPFFWET